MSNGFETSGSFILIFAFWSGIDFPVPAPLLYLEVDNLFGKLSWEAQR